MKIGFISDIHEDFIRLKETVLAMERIGVDEIICLGDIVGYSVPFYGYLSSRNANGVVDLIRDYCSVVVVGNHDLFAVRQIPHNSNFDYPAEWYSLEFTERKLLSRNKVFLYEDHELPSLLNMKNIEYIASLPEYKIHDCGDHKLLISHYAFPDVTGSCTVEINSPELVRAHLDTMQELGCQYGMSGNDHREGFRLLTYNTVQDYGFIECQLPSVPAWINGPSIAKGTTMNGFMIYDSSSRLISSVELNTPLHTLPLSI